MKRILLTFFLFGIPIFGFSQVGINTTSPNAQLDIRSGNQAAPSNTDGILIPKIDAFPLTNPTAAQQGMMVYLTTVSAGKQPGFYYWDSSGTPQWRGFGGTTGWQLTGNSGTNPTVNFIGTTDNQDVVFKRNNIVSGKITTNNTSYGNAALNPASSGVGNLAVGNASLFSNTLGDGNTSVGFETLYSNTEGYSNAAFGGNALHDNIDGYNNAAFGNAALNKNTTGLHNVAIGTVSLYKNTEGIYNTALGSEALYNNTFGSNNTAVGFDSGTTITTGSNNITLGSNTNVPSPTASDQMSIGNVIYGATMSTTALGKIGIGVPVPTVKLDVEETSNLTSSVLNVKHSNPTATTKLIKTSVNSGALSSGVITSNENSIVLTNSVQGIGVLNAISGTTNDAVYGFRNLISNVGSSVKYGLNNSFTGAGTGSVYGVSNTFSTLTSTQQNGMFNSFTGTPTGASIGVNNAIEDNGNADKIGVLDSITNGGNGRHFGIKNIFKGNGSGQRFGISNTFKGNGNGAIWSSYTDILGAGNGEIIGHYLNINRSGTGNHFGMQNYLDGNTTGAKYGVDNVIAAYNSSVQPQQGVSNYITGTQGGPHTGVNNWLSGDGNGLQYCIYNYINNTGVGDKYGIYNYIPPATNGLHYGVYSNVTKTNSYAGYFLGRVAIGTDALNNYILPSTRGTLNQIMQTDGTGNVSWVSPSTIASGTLDQAYDFGGAGLGRTITADAGAVTINGTDGLVSNGTFGSGATMPSLGGATRMVWNPRKAAFRAGYVLGTQWDDSNVGVYSAAFGSGTKASGVASTAFGSDTSANGLISTAFGNSSVADGVYSTAFGASTKATSTNSTAFGSFTTANGTTSTAFGSSSVANGNYSTVFGASSVANGDSSTTFGYINTASSFGETVFGIGATTYTTSANGAIQFRPTNATDRLFVIGNAIDTNANNNVDPGERSDAIVVLKNGNTGIGNSAPALARLQVQGAVGNTVATFSGSANSQGVSVVSDWPGIYFNSYYSGGVRSMAGTGFTSIVNTDQSTGGLIFQTTNIANTASGSLLGTIPTRMTITGSGNVGIGTPSPGGLFELSLDQGRKPGTSTWTITSDERLKTIHGNYSKGLEEILKLQPITYNYINSGKRTFEEKVLQKEFSGFSAQAVQKIFPEAVGIDDDGFLNFNMHPILVAFVNAFKELDAKDKALQTQLEEIKTQKDEINSLKAINEAILKRLEKLENK